MFFVMTFSYFLLFKFKSPYICADSMLDIKNRTDIHNEVTNNNKDPCKIKMFISSSWIEYYLCIWIFSMMVDDIKIVKKFYFFLIMIAIF
jgi:hypothetical protein